MLFKFYYYLLLVFFCGNNLYAMEAETECSKPHKDTQLKPNTGGNSDNPSALSSNVNNIDSDITKEDTPVKKDTISDIADSINHEKNKTVLEILCQPKFSVLVAICTLLLSYSVKKIFLKH